jgi:hypothetical protein
MRNGMNLRSMMLAQLAKVLPFVDLIETRSFFLEGSDEEFFTAYGEAVLDDDRVSIVFNVPSSTDSVFIAITRKAEEDVCRIVANLEDYEREKSICLTAGDVVILPEGRVDIHTYPYAAILLRTESSPILASLPDEAIVGGVLRKFYLTVPLNNSEYKFRLKFGHDDLMERFDSENKHLDFFV